MTCYNFEEKGHYSSACPKKDDQVTTSKKEKSMVVASWRASDCDADLEEQKTQCFIVNNGVCKTSFTQAIMITTLNELREVVNDQKE